MRQYLDLMQKIKNEGTNQQDRTWTGTRSIFGAQTKYDLTEWFPLVTTKKLHTKSIVCELLWILRGDTNVKYLQDNGVRIRNEWADENGDLGPVYWHQRRNFNSQGIDQLANAIDLIRKDPNSRRIIISAWNPAQLDQMALAPCHAFIQFHVDTSNKKINLQLYQRSADMFLGVPFNIASYSLLLTMIAQITGYTPWVFTHTLGDAHIYSDHRDQVNEQLKREPLPLPTLEIKKAIHTLEDMINLELEDFEFKDYKSHPAIKAKVAV